MFPVGSLFRLRVSHHLGHATFQPPPVLSRQGLVTWRRSNAMGLQLLKFQAGVTASRHVLIAAARNVRCVEAEVRWRWTLKVLKTAA